MISLDSNYRRLCGMTFNPPHVSTNSEATLVEQQLISGDLPEATHLQTKYAGKVRGDSIARVYADVGDIGFARRFVVHRDVDAYVNHVDNFSFVEGLWKFTFDSNDHLQVYASFDYFVIELFQYCIPPELWDEENRNRAGMPDWDV